MAYVNINWTVTETEGNKQVTDHSSNLETYSYNMQKHSLKKYLKRLHTFFLHVACWVCKYALQSIDFKRFSGVPFFPRLSYKYRFLLYIALFSPFLWTQLQYKKANRHDWYSSKYRQICYYRVSWKLCGKWGIATTNSFRIQAFTKINSRLRAKWYCRLPHGILLNKSIVFSGDIQQTELILS